MPALINPRDVYGELKVDYPPVNIFRPTQVAILLLLTGATAFAQSAESSSIPTASPEAGFISREKYTNAFFGFSMALPQNIPIKGLAIPPKDAASHFLFGLQAQSKGLTVLTISAKESKKASSEDARKAAAGPKGDQVKRVEIGGKEFWRSEMQSKSPAGKMRDITFATSLDDYVLELEIIAFDSKLADELEHDIEAITFFDPATARDRAGADSRAYGSVRPGNPSTKSRIDMDKITPGVVSENGYKNEALGFEFKFPSGWVVADNATQQKVLQAGHEFAWGSSSSAQREHEVVNRCTRTLLWVTKYREGTKTDEVNPLVVVIAMDPTGLPDARFPSIDDREGIERVTRQIGQAFAGTPFINENNSSVRARTIQGRLMLDISANSAVKAPGRDLLLNVYSSFAFTEQKGYWLAWILMSGTQSGLLELKNLDISFMADH